ncbi:defensin-like protein [Solanum lycopersicum]|uniref:Knottins-like domain-containing protein n=1 Tax=Solanum lycopersicum TaxID=4081 RepID=A0A3Q7H5S2_SOLLC|nr:defensin-like protein [Solanum lycopersicum]
MARSICFMAFVVLAMMLFVSYEVQAQPMCKSTSQTFKGLCFTDSSCRKACLKEEFEGGHCSKLQRKCLCTKICVFDKISDEVKTNFGWGSKNS